MTKVAVVGVGNILMGDEGIGVKAVNALKKSELSEETKIFDAGTAFYALINELVKFDKLIIVDAVRNECSPGTIYRFGLKEIKEKPERLLSLHEVGVVETLMLESLVSTVPEEIVFIGIEPEKIEPSMELSPVIKGKLPELVQMIIKEIQRTNEKIVER